MEGAAGEAAGEEAGEPARGEEEREGGGGDGGAHGRHAITLPIRAPERFGWSILGKGALCPRERASLPMITAVTFGILELTLRPASYDWRFVPIAGSTFTDAGSAGCH